MELREKLHEDLKYFIVNVGWTHKIHIVYSDKLSFWNNIIQAIQIFSTAVTTSGIVNIALGKGSDTYNIFITISSFVTLIMTGIDQVIEVKKLSIKEKQVANNFWKLREKGLRLLSSVQFQTESEENIQINFENLINLREEYSSDLSNVPKRYVDEASKLIKVRKDNDYAEDYKYFIPDNLMNLKEEKK